jgi:acyl-CoA synthetase (AMP-forming)/AMP-acid ligase II
VALVGRLTETFKSGGYNVYPREVESVLETCPGVASAAVVDVPDPVYSEVGVAFVETRPGIDIDVDNVVAHCRERLARYKVPKRFVVVDALPRLPVGKVDRAALRARARAAAG